MSLLLAVGLLSFKHIATASATPPAAAQSASADASSVVVVITNQVENPTPNTCAPDAYELSVGEASEPEYNYFLYLPVLRR